jgi:hypothetical protein
MKIDNVCELNADTLIKVDIAALKQITMINLNHYQILLKLNTDDLI